MTLCHAGGDLFLRQRTLPGWTPSHQERLAASRVLVAGVGGVGGVVAQYLAMAGVGHLVLVHEGPLDPPDLNRQTLMRHSAIGRPRVYEAASRLSEQVPGIDILALDQPVDDALLPSIPGVDLFVDARLNFPERYALNRIAIRTGVSLIVGAMNGMEGMVLCVSPRRTACLRCVFSTGDPEWNPLEFPVLGAVSGMVGSLAALEAVKRLSDYAAREPFGKMIFFDATNLLFREFSVRRNPDCPDCGIHDDRPDPEGTPVGRKGGVR